MEDLEMQTGTRDAQLGQWGAKFERLVAAAKESGQEAKRDYRMRVEDLNAKHRVAQSKFEEFKAAESENWEILRVGLENAWKELEAALVKLKI